MAVEVYAEECEIGECREEQMRVDVEDRGCGEDLVDDVHKWDLR